MSRAQTNHFAPDYLVPPGEILEDYLDALGMTQAELADRMGLSYDDVFELWED